jgi:hypothetical protein
MPINDTKDFFYVTPTGEVYTGDDPPSGSTVLVAPGGTISDELAAKYEVTDRLKGDGESPVRRDDAGNPIVVRGGKAYAASVLDEDDPERKAVEQAATKEDEAKAAEGDQAAEAEVKTAVEGDKADKLAEAPDARSAEAEVKAKADEADEEKKPVATGVEAKAIHRDDAGIQDKSIHPDESSRKGPVRPVTKGK